MSILAGFVEDFAVDLVVQECRSMHGWTHDGYGLGWAAGLVRIVDCTDGKVSLRGQTVVR